MSLPVDAEQLVELLDRQFEYFLSLQGTTKLVRLRRLMNFLHAEPRLAGLLRDLSDESAAGLAAYGESVGLIRDDLRALWDQHEADIRRTLNDDPDGPVFAYGSFDSLRVRLDEWKPTWDDLGDGETVKRFRDCFHALGHWAKCITDRDSDGPLASAMHQLRTATAYVQEIYEHDLQHFQEEAKSSAWTAYRGLDAWSSFTNPPVPPIDDVLGRAAFVKARKDATEFPSKHLLKDSGALAATADADDCARFLHEELRFRIGLGLSRLALVHRYATRCVHFDAERVRKLCSRQAGQAERRLTDDFARYLFDQGLMPLTEVPIGGLRPDLIELSGGALFYVEAKQYAEKNPRTKIVRAFHQTWETLGRLEAPFRVNEAFLLIFRRGGRSLVLPRSLRSGERTLYPVFVDIAPARTSGSRAKDAPIILTEADLLPK